MEKTGLIAEILTAINNNWKEHCLLNECKEKQSYDASLRESLVLLKKVHGCEDVSLLLGIEKMLLIQEQTHYANSPEEVSSIKKALIQLDEAKTFFPCVHDHKIYKNVTLSYSGRRKENNLPLDCFREFIKSHSTRLTNRLAAPLPIPEKNLLRQRKDNMRVAKELYIDFQRKALDIPAPSKDIGLER